MAIQILRAENEETREKVYRFRYRIHCEELNKGGAGVDHRRKMIRDPEDQAAVILYAEENGEIVGTVRSCFSSIDPFPEPLRETFAIAPLLENWPGEVSVTGRFMISPSYRGRTLFSLLAKEIYQIGLTEIETQVDYCMCEVALLPFYYRLGYRRYMHTVHPEDTGLRIPLLLCLRDAQYLESVQSPFRRCFVAGMDDHGQAADCCARTYPHFERRPEIYGGDDRTLWAQLARTGTLRKNMRPRIFDGLENAVQEKILSRAVGVSFRAGEKIYQRQEQQALGLILDGEVGVGIDAGNGSHHWVEFLDAGDLFGHVLPSSHKAHTDLVAMRDTRAAFLANDFITRLPVANPDVFGVVAQNLFCILSDRLNESHRAAALLHHSTSPDSR